MSRLSNRLRTALRPASLAFTRHLHRGNDFLLSLGSALSGANVLASLVCLVTLVIHVGYDHSVGEYKLLSEILHVVQIVFCIEVTFSFTFNLRKTIQSTRLLKWAVDIAVLLTIIPLIVPRQSVAWLGAVSNFLYSGWFLYGVLFAYSGVTLCYEIFHLVDRRTNPSLLLSFSFIVFIMIGTFLLLLPKSTVGGISFVDALFVSTSAVCVTGLTPVDVSTTFTPLGLGILALLIQIGALGVMTFTSFFALFFSGNASIFSQLMLRDAIYSKSFNSLLPTLFYILCFTIAVEASGALLVFISVHDTLGMNVKDEVVFSLFHSLSAFCNAGFSNLPDGMANTRLLFHNTSIYWITTMLIIAGSIGFPILVNTKDAMIRNMRRFISRLFHRPCEPRTVHQFNMNTRIVLFTFTLLFAAGTALFFVLEYSNSLSGMTLWQKITQSAFNSAVPRSAGFSSVNPAGFLNVTLVMILFLMWVGGGSQSTGGGIKVNTLAAIWLNLRAIVTGTPRVTAYGRTIAVGSIRRANAVVAISIFSYFTLSFLLLGIESDLPAKAVLFESCSALFTVGSSLGITPLLSTTSKLLLCAAMFLGRVGIISLLTGVVDHKHRTGATLPTDNIIIN